MEQGAGSSAWRRQGTGSDLVGEETGLPLIKCPDCKMCRLIERRSKKENENFGRVYIRCPCNYSWIANKCSYYRWQRAYLDDLVARRLVQLLPGESEEEIEMEEEVQSIPKRRAAGINGQNMEAKIEKLTKAVMFLSIFVVGFVGVVVGYMLKYG